MYWRSFPIGDPSGVYKAPYANIYRAMAILGTQASPTSKVSHVRVYHEHCDEYQHWR